MSLITNGQFFPFTEMDSQDDFDRFLPGSHDISIEDSSQEDSGHPEHHGQGHEQGAEQEDSNNNSKLLDLMTAMQATMNRQFKNVSKTFSSLTTRMSGMESRQTAMEGGMQEPDPEEDENPGTLEEPLTMDFQELINEASLAEAKPEASDTVNPSTEEDELLAEFLKQAESEELLDEEVEPRVAAIINTLFRKRMDREKFKKLMEDISTARPKNCEGLSAIITNPMLWAMISDSNKTRDRKLQSFQKELVKAASLMTKIFNTLIAAKGDVKKLNIVDILTKMNDALALLGDLNYNIAMFRRNALKPDLKPCYQKLCAETVPLTKELFGDDLAKLVKEAGEVSKLSKKVTTSYPNNFRGKAQSSFRQTSFRHQPYQQHQPQSTRSTGRGARGSSRGQNFHQRRGEKPQK